MHINEYLRFSIFCWNRKLVQDKLKWWSVLIRQFLICVKVQQSHGLTSVRFSMLVSSARILKLTVTSLISCVSRLIFHFELDELNRYFKVRQSIWIRGCCFVQVMSVFYFLLSEMYELSFSCSWTHVIPAIVTMIYNSVSCSTVWWRITEDTEGIKCPRVLCCDTYDDTDPAIRTDSENSWKPKPVFNMWAWR